MSQLGAIDNGKRFVYSKKPGTEKTTSHMSSSLASKLPIITVDLQWIKLINGNQRCSVAELGTFGIF